MDDSCLWTRQTFIHTTPSHIQIIQGSDKCYNISVLFLYNYVLKWLKTLFTVTSIRGITMTNFSIIAVTSARVKTLQRLLPQSACWHTGNSKDYFCVLERWMHLYLFNTWLESHLRKWFEQLEVRHLSQTQMTLECIYTWLFWHLIAIRSAQDACEVKHKWDLLWKCPFCIIVHCKISSNDCLTLSSARMWWDFGGGDVYVRLCRTIIPA